MIFVSFVYFFGLFSESLSLTDPVDKSVLVDLYNSSSGANWASNYGWSNISSDPCFDSWYGITCTSELDVQHVTVIDLNDNHLAGNIYSVRFNFLVQLEIVNLKGNDLLSLFPQSILASESLKLIDLSSNQAFYVWLYPIKPYDITLG